MLRISAENSLSRFIFEQSLPAPKKKIFKDRQKYLRSFLGLADQSLVKFSDIVPPELIDSEFTSVTLPVYDDQYGQVRIGRYEGTDDDEFVHSYLRDTSLIVDNTPIFSVSDGCIFYRQGGLPRNLSLAARSLRHPRYAQPREIIGAASATKVFVRHLERNYGPWDPQPEIKLHHPRPPLIDRMWQDIAKLNIEL